MRPGFTASDPLALTAGKGDASIERYSELERDMRSVQSFADKEPGEAASGLIASDVIDQDAGPSDTFHARAIGPSIRI